MLLVIILPYNITILVYTESVNKMKLSRKKIALLFTSFITVGLVTTVAVACTPQNQRKENENENAQLSSNSSEGVNTKPQQTLAPILNKIEKR